MPNEWTTRPMEVSDSPEMPTMQYMINTTHLGSLNMGQIEGEGFFQKLGLKRSASQMVVAEPSGHTKDRRDKIAPLISLGEGGE